MDFWFVQKFFAASFSRMSYALRKTNIVIVVRVHSQLDVSIVHHENVHRLYGTTTTKDQIRSMAVANFCVNVYAK